MISRRGLIISLGSLFGGAIVAPYVPKTIYFDLGANRIVGKVVFDEGLFYCPYVPFVTQYRLITLGDQHAGGARIQFKDLYAG